MLTEKELRILELFMKNPFASYTIRELMKRIKTKSYDWTHKTATKLIKENIIKTEKKGQANLCTLNLNEHKTILYLSLLEETKAITIKIPNLSKIMGVVPSQFNILLITGSYVDGTHTEESDMDVVAIIENKEEKKWVINQLTNKGELMIPKLHPYVFTREEFLEMLSNNEQNYGKEIEKKHLIIFGAENYYQILKEGIKNGYNR
ncbi:MAG: nucleotidyltransferase domain-containing protein [Nanoarchaeota archaeon]|nr:nucleotidyltransferase domain-containing protein [Nanoarchaeota archaeon]